MLLPTNEIHKEIMYVDPLKMYTVTPLVRGFVCKICGLKGGSNRQDYLVKHLVHPHHRTIMRQTQIVVKPVSKVSSRPITHNLSLPELVLHCVIIAGCQHGQSYRGTERCLRLVARVIATILDGWDVKHLTQGKSAVMVALKTAGLHKAAKVVSRLVTLGKSELTNQEEPRSVIVRDCNIGKRVVNVISEQVQNDITAVLKKRFIGAGCDESVVTDKTRPIFVILQVITIYFQ